MMVKLILYCNTKKKFKTNANILLVHILCHFDWYYTSSLLAISINKNRNSFFLPIDKTLHLQS